MYPVVMLQVLLNDNREPDTLWFAHVFTVVYVPFAAFRSSVTSAVIFVVPEYPSTIAEQFAVVPLKDIEILTSLVFVNRVESR